MLAELRVALTFTDLNEIQIYVLELVRLLGCRRRYVKRSHSYVLPVFRLAQRPKRVSRPEDHYRLAYMPLEDTGAHARLYREVNMFASARTDQTTFHETVITNKRDV